MAYRLRRPPQPAGLGPMTLYRSIANADQPLQQEPARWVRSQPAFRALSESPTPTIAVALTAASVGAVDKVWTELAYEAARVRIAAEMPSRLDSLYAYADPIEAFSFTEITGEPKQVWEAEVPEGVPWAVVDMSVFKVVQAATIDEEGFSEAWDRALEAAKRYWRPADDPATAEVLVSGPMRLTRRLQLIPLLQELDLVEPPDS